MKQLTEKQKKVLEFITEYTKENGYPPSIREVGGHFGILWPAARGHMKSLEKKGFIRINSSVSRGIEITGLKPSGGIIVPVAGRIRAGKPSLAVEQIDSHILVDKTLFPHEGAFSLKVKGDSMIEAGILDGDYVIIKPQSDIENGEIGVALIGDEATVKRVFKEKKRIVLKPENRDMEPVSYSAGEVGIIGKVTGVVRKMG